MSSNWPVKKLGDLVTFLSGGTPSKSNKDYWNGEIPWISASSMQSTRYHDSELRVTSLGSNNGTRKVPAGTVLLLVRGGALHNKIPVGITTRDVTFNQDVKALVPKSEDITPNYLLAWLLSSRQLLLSKVENTGIGAGKLDTKILQELDVPVPPKADLLRLELFSKALDDKIILNQNITQTLEQMAQALFKSWFVDFEPVKAKMAVLGSGGSQEDATFAAMSTISGKDADALVVFERGHPEQYAELKATAELFPSAMQDSELGEIPEGWSIGKLGEIIEFNPKRVLKKGNVAPYLDMKNVPVTGHSAQDVIDREFSSGSKFRNGDTLLARITPCLENGKTAYVDFLPTDESVGWGSTEFIIMRSKKNLPLSLSYFFARLDSFRTIAIKSMQGTSGRQRADASVLEQHVWIIPSNKTLQKFGIFSDLILNNNRARNFENDSLGQLRDTLLPKLLSGEITLPEAEQALIEVENV